LVQCFSHLQFTGKFFDFLSSYNSPTFRSAGVAYGRRFG
jgi:hypothetical protein